MFARRDYTYIHKSPNHYQWGYWSSENMNGKFKVLGNSYSPNWYEAADKAKEAAKKASQTRANVFFSHDPHSSASVFQTFRIN